MAIYNYEIEFDKYRIPLHLTLPAAKVQNQNIRFNTLPSIVACKFWALFGALRPQNYLKSDSGIMSKGLSLMMAVTFEVM